MIRIAVLPLSFDVRSFEFFRCRVLFPTFSSTTFVFSAFNLRRNVVHSSIQLRISFFLRRFLFFFLSLFGSLLFHAFKKVLFSAKWNSCHSDTETVSRLIQLVSFWTSIYSFAGLLNFFDSKPSFGFNFHRINKNSKYSYQKRKKTVENFLSHPFSFIFIFADSWCYYFSSFYAWHLDCQYTIYTHIVSLCHLINYWIWWMIIMCYLRKKHNPKKCHQMNLLGRFYSYASFFMEFPLCQH